MIPERGRARDAPTHPGARLPAGTQRVRFAVDVRLVKGGPTRVGLSAQGYRASGGLPVTASTSVRLAARSAPETLTVEIEAPEPMTAFRLRVAVRSGSNWPGALHVGEPRIEPR